MACNFGKFWACLAMFRNFGHDNDERCLLKRNVFPVTVEVLFLVSSRKVLSSQTGNSGIC